MGVVGRRQQLGHDDRQDEAGSSLGQGQEVVRQADAAQLHRERSRQDGPVAVPGDRSPDHHQPDRPGHETTENPGREDVSGRPAAE